MPPGYIQQMPTVERVLSDMKVADSVDTRARQYVAVSDLGHILFVLTWDRGVVRTSDNHTRSGLTPEETRLERGYRDASNRLLLGSGGVWPGCLDQPVLSQGRTVSQRAPRPLLLARVEGRFPGTRRTAQGRAGRIQTSKRFRRAGG